MARSSFDGLERANPRQPGHDIDSLGPSDTSDSGSDMAGIDELDAADPQLPIDVALQPDRQRSSTPIESLSSGGDSDSSGSGERASAAGDGPSRDAADISPDRIDDLGESSGSGDDDELLDIDSASVDVDDEEDADGQGDIDR